MTTLALPPADLFTTPTPSPSRDRAARELPSDTPTFRDALADLRRDRRPPETDAIERRETPVRDDRDERADAPDAPRAADRSTPSAEPTADRGSDDSHDDSHEDGAAAGDAPAVTDAGSEPSSGGSEPGARPPITSSASGAPNAQAAAVTAQPLPALPTGGAAPAVGPEVATPNDVSTDRGGFTSGSPVTPEASGATEPVTDAAAPAATAPTNAATRVTTTNETPAPGSAALDTAARPDAAAATDAAAASAPEAARAAAPRGAANEPRSRVGVPRAVAATTNAPRADAVDAGRAADATTAAAEPVPQPTSGSERIAAARAAVLAASSSSDAAPAVVRADDVDNAVRAAQTPGANGAAPRAVGLPAPAAAPLPLAAAAAGTAGEAPAPSAPEPAPSPFTHRIMRGLSAMVGQRGGVMTMRLQPADLGQLRVQMSIVQGVVSASFTAATDEARQLIQKDLGMLRTALERHGLTVERMTVAVNGPNDSGNGVRNESGDAGGRHGTDADQDAADGESRGRREQERDERDGATGPAADLFGERLRGAVTSDATQGADA